MQTKNNNIFLKIKTYFQEFSQSTGIHGFRYLTEKRSKVEKIFWILILLISLNGCIYMIFEICMKYETNPVVVTFASKDTEIYEIPFPAVTICPESKSSRTKFNFTDVYNKIQLGLTSRLNYAIFKRFYYMNLLCDDYTHDGNGTVDDDFFDIIDSLKPDESFICYYFQETKNCSELFIPIITDEGICYSFNILDRSDLYKENVVHHKNFHHVGINNTSYYYQGDLGYTEDAGVYTYPTRALNSGADNSLTIYFAHIRNDTDYICNKFLQGYRILLHNPVDIPRLSKLYFRVPLNKAVTAVVTPDLITISKSLKNVRPEKRDCYLHSERPLKFFKIYTQSNCFLECLTNHTLNACGCVNYFMPRSNGTKICGTGSIDCALKIKNELKIKELENKISGSRERNVFYCNCKPSCNELNYNVDVSTSDFYWDEYFKAQSKISFNYEFNEKQFSVLSIYFKKDQFIALERNEIYGISDFVSNIGGLLGLFTGFSLISLVEIVYFVTLRIIYNLRLYGRWWGSQ